jgi:hypothetical protein
MHHAWNLQSLQQSQQGHVGQGVCPLEALNIRSSLPKNSDAAWRTCTALRDRGILCSRTAFIRSAGMVHDRSCRSISLHLAPGPHRSGPSQDQELQAELCRRVGGGFLHLGHYSGNIGIVLQRRFKEGCLRVREGESGAWHGTGGRVRCDVVYPPATTATPKVRTAPRAASHAPPDTPAPW